MSDTVAGVVGEVGYALRLPPELKARLESLAKENHRSLNSEIVHALDLYAKTEERRHG